QDSIRQGFKSLPNGMKDSGVEWLGMVPAHWEVKRLKYIARFRSGESITSENIEPEGQFPVYGGNGQRGFASNYTHDGEFILIGRQGALCGNINFANGKFWASEHAVVVRSTAKIVVRWLGELLYAMNLNQYNISAAQPGLAVERIQELAIPLPPLSEQRAIAAYLDRETARIDTLIAKQEQLIALIDEKRQALISHAVTKGVSHSIRQGFKSLPNGMKDSGVEWLGAIPEHWEVKRLKYVLNLVTRKVPVGSSKAIALENIQSWTGNIVESETEYESEGIEFHAGDILFGKLRPYLAKVYRAESNGISVGDIFVLRAGNQNSTHFYSLILRTRDYISAIDSSTYGAKMPRVSWEYFSNLPIPLPPLDEQRAIAAYLDRETAKLDTLKAKAQSAIELLREKRSALISAAVTGKIDIRPDFIRQGFKSLPNENRGE
ncbi:MAG TPA: restriction endonuclease subunit S, partial [Turneriella sp.]|nr:restriction endonuclease subunit S [Turneriella sp.]